MTPSNPERLPATSRRGTLLSRQELLCAAMTGEGHPTPDLESLLTRLKLREGRP